LDEAGGLWALSEKAFSYLRESSFIFLQWATMINDTDIFSKNCLISGHTSSIAARQGRTITFLFQRTIAAKLFILVLFFFHE